MTRQRALLFDVGNTRLKWGLAIDGALRRTGSVTHERLAEQGLGALTGQLPDDVDAVLASNVAGPTFATRLSGVIGMHCNRDVHFARSEAQAFGVTNSYRQPRRMGVDRWVAMVGAREALSGALLVVDAGTAVTVDALAADGRHLGGQILPGLRLMMSSLHEDTSDLPPVRRAPSSGDAVDGFAASTGSAIWHGALAAVCGAVERGLRRLRAGGHRPRLVLTGGDASRILNAVDAKAEHRPHLVLEGLAVMVRNRS